MPNIRNGWKVVLLQLLLFVTLPLLVEGMASFALSFFISRGRAEQKHTEHDALLGWINLPNLYIPNMYGPGVYLRTNLQRFRNEKDIVSAPAGTRVICSGDSFTLGYGVSNADTWCHRLGDLVPNTETINMGPGGYGIDQAYLWYKRDGVKIPHHALIFAFIHLDFDRMSSDTFVGSAKPTLSLRDGMLNVDNTPVPRRGIYSRFYERILQKARGLSIVRIVALMGDSSKAAKVSESEKVDPMPVALAVFEDLQRLHREKGTQVSFVLLPDRRELQDPETEWRNKLSSEMAKRHLRYFDLVDMALKYLDNDEKRRMFFRSDEAGKGHLTSFGNEKIAQFMLDRQVIARPRAQ